MLLLLLFVLVIGAYVAGHFLNEAKLDRQREAIGSFVAPTDWEELTHPNYVGPFSDSFCMLPANFCNWHHSRTWEEARPSATELRAMAEASGWKEIEFSAEPGHYSDACEEEGEGSYWCPLRAVSGKVSFELKTFRSSSGGGWHVRLSAY
ncbi:MAG: hypothetical protein OXG66_06145 [Acidimicrobiaceae bacterium]|nr:hypothetical protein [Acidimicrobiaceae bacterium]